MPKEQINEDRGQGRFPRLKTFRLDAATDARLKREVEYRQQSVSEFSRRAVLKELDLSPQLERSDPQELSSDKVRLLRIYPNGEFREICPECAYRRSDCTHAG